MASRKSMNITASLTARGFDLEWNTITANLLAKIYNNLLSGSTKRPWPLYFSLIMFEVAFPFRCWIKVAIRDSERPFWFTRRPRAFRLILRARNNSLDSMHSCLVLLPASGCVTMLRWTPLKGCAKSVLLVLLGLGRHTVGLAVWCEETPLQPFEGFRSQQIEQ